MVRIVSNPSDTSLAVAEIEVIDSHVHEHMLGRIRAEVIEGNIIITVEREDESKFGPVSLVVV